MIRILVADDHKMFRKGLKKVLEYNQDMVVADEASNGHEVLEKVSKNDYDILLLDIAMPGMNGLETLKQLKSQKAKLRIIVVSMYPEQQYAVRSIKAGASGYLTKESDTDELIEAIKKVYEGGRYISSSIAENLLFDLEPESERPIHENLSDREFQILCMIAKGKTVSEIAEELFLSVKTVSTYRCRILEKMRMKSNAELTNYTLKNQLILLTD
jgi:two-component system invasion response regulator UvrY